MPGASSLVACPASDQLISSSHLTYLSNNQNKQKTTKLLQLKFYLAVGEWFISNNWALQISSLPNITLNFAALCLHTNTYIYKQNILNTLRKIFSDVAWPPGSQKICRPLWSQKNCKIPKKTPLEPLDLLATVGQSCVCECVCVWVCVCVWWRTTLWCCDVVVSQKKTTILCPSFQGWASVLFKRTFSEKRM